ncbi:hypothetical protein J2T60_002369 [Natronospira proteinivora]|uniref:Uncharacterized protein n=1 Tax=Natronospira proteinivora TaxID=1807133 RepID=A0ABT1GAL4_9GAMM|nr:hypothetical protein [Natronospira proteinivora]MCP1728369.1 hypothetical protein [Natronospira proteinivora]
MRRAPSQQTHRRWIKAMMGFGQRYGLYAALIPGTFLLWMAWQDALLLSAIVAGPIAGGLSFQAAYRYYQGGDESQWLLMLAFGFSGWPILQLLERDGLTHWEQGQLTLQYFALVIAIWLVLAWMRGRLSQ